MLERDYDQFDKYVTQLTQDVYAQPPDAGQQAMGENVINTYGRIPQGLKTVLDVGCGQGQFKEPLEALGLEWTGITLGEDYQVCKENGLNVHEVDMTFMPFEDNSFDMVFARHTLEHSPFPLITLMEFRRVCSGYLLMIVPATDMFEYRGANHYSVLPFDLWDWLLKRSGWYSIHDSEFHTHDPVFLQSFEPYQKALGGDGVPAEVLVDYPQVNFEYRFLCQQEKPRRE